VSEIAKFSVQNPVLHFIPGKTGGGGLGRLVLMHTAQPAKRGQAGADTRPVFSST